jgi:hypothetical protein
MFTTVLITVLLASGPWGPAPQWPAGYQQPTGPWFYQWHYAATSPWNSAVASLQARGPARSSDRRPPADLASELAALEARRADLYDQLRSAPAEKKPDLRARWRAARQDLERARLQAARFSRR